MKITMLWHGGTSYRAPYAADAEHFPSLAAATAEFASRASGSDRFYPCVEDSEAWIWLGSVAGDYPDRIMRMGKRGGVVVERC